MMLICYVNKETFLVFIDMVIYNILALDLEVSKYGQPKVNFIPVQGKGHRSRISFVMIIL